MYERTHKSVCIRFHPKFIFAENVKRLLSCFPMTTTQALFLYCLIMDKQISINKHCQVYDKHRPLNKNIRMNHRIKNTFSEYLSDISIKLSTYENRKSYLTYRNTIKTNIFQNIQEHDRHFIIIVRKIFQTPGSHIGQCLRF